MINPAFLGRGAFFQLCSACSAFLTQSANPQTTAAPQPNRAAVRNQKNFAAIQVKPYAGVDEGIDALVDNIQHKGAVNTVWAYTYDFSESRMTREGTTPLPDYGVPGSPAFVGGAFYDYDLWLANLEAAGETLREILSRRPA